MRNDELFTAEKGELIAEYEQRMAPHVPLSVATLEMELQRRAVLDLVRVTEDLTSTTRQLAASSHRLEKLTKWLMALTILLLVAASPPALEALHKVFR